ncbi:MAG: rhodanese-like domain-containing protein [Planctomycetes bacterium]|jgi:thiosulfate/3-mercaptopyruvate sulfurtransferase|nr:rhodanese-like domain-containing protein [Planctomycetota bacterium]
MNTISPTMPAAAVGTPSSTSAWLGIATMLAAIGAALLVAPGPNQDRAATAAAASSWLQQIETGADHIETDELLHELLTGSPGLLLVDVRPADEFAAWHLPGAVNLGVPELCGAAGAALFATSPRLVVLYSNGPAHPGQAWVELQRQGRTNVKVLAGGLDEFRDHVLCPPSLRATAAPSAAAGASSAWQLQRAFLLGAEVAPAASGWATDPDALTQPTMVSTAWLATHSGEVIALDTRSRAEFAALHLPGAHSLPPSELRQRAGDRDLLLRPDAELAATFGALGIGADTPVVIYADDRLHDATLVAVAMLRLGHQRLAILDGGIRRWAAERRPLLANTTPPIAVPYAPRPGAEPFAISTDELAAAVAAKATTVLDVRPTQQFTGAVSTEARPGHIPGAINRPLANDLTAVATGRSLRPRAEVAAAYAEFPLDAQLSVSCRTGHSASQTWFVLRHLLGYQNVRWYNGSWTEWSARPELPAATGAR